MRELGSLRPRWVDLAAQLEEVCAAARAAGRVAVDTEADSMHAYHEKLCLVQLSFDGQHAIIDPLELGRDGLAPLAALLADPAVVKVMHGADYDLRMLDRDLGAHLCGLEDTQMAAQLIGEGSFGLAALVSTKLGVVLDKKFQRSDWSIRPLGSEELRYAAADTA